MNLTKEYFDAQLKKLASKADLEAQSEALVNLAEAQTQTLARIIEETINTPMLERFDVLETKLDSAIKRVDTAETKLQRLEAALHITL